MEQLEPAKDYMCTCAHACACVHVHMCAHVRACACKVATCAHTSEATGLRKVVVLNKEVIEEDILELIEAAHCAAAAAFLHGTNDRLKKLQARKMRPRE